MILRTFGAVHRPDSQPIDVSTDFTLVIRLTGKMERSKKKPAQVPRSGPIQVDFLTAGTSFFGLLKSGVSRKQYVGPYVVDDRCQECTITVEAKLDERLPSIKDQDCWIAFLGILFARDSPLANPVEFEMSELISALGYEVGPVAGHAYRQVFEWVSVMQTVKLTIELGIRRVIDTTIFTRVDTTKQPRTKFSVVVADPVMASLSWPHSIAIDLLKYLALSFPLAKAFALLIGTSQDTEGIIRLPYAIVCDRFQLAKKDKPGKIVSQIASALNELSSEQCGYLSAWSLEGDSIRLVLPAERPGPLSGSEEADVNPGRFDSEQEPVSTSMIGGEKSPIEKIGYREVADDTKLILARIRAKK